ncbi:MAG TPA: SRPBCC family protein [Candidatus Saccharimonadia bacterium]|nr:SRPBCC family protein [Candidatus Saccharimonadia bacterium]
MDKLYARESIVIAAPPEIVWGALTDANSTAAWVGHFQAVFARLESDWHRGSRVEWKNKTGGILVDGRVIEERRLRLLKYTVHDTSGAFDDVKSDEDGITYQLRPMGTKNGLNRIPR